MAMEFLVAESSNRNSILTWLISRETIVNIINVAKVLSTSIYVSLFVLRETQILGLLCDITAVLSPIYLQYY